jgi:predicted house-cleaning noncanonical NTP pyrophosphatase (MazG superfamily)
MNFLEICKEHERLERELSNKIQENLLTFFDGMDKETLDQMCEIIDETIKNS